MADSNIHLGDALEEFLEKANVNRLIRSHQSTRGAYENLWDGLLIHIFSAYPYPPESHISDPYTPKISKGVFAFKDESSSIIIYDNKGKELDIV